MSIPPEVESTDLLNIKRGHWLGHVTLPCVSSIDVSPGGATINVKDEVLKLENGKLPEEDHSAIEADSMKTAFRPVEDLTQAVEMELIHAIEVLRMSAPCSFSRALGK
jgi:hypothetical protein